MLKATRLRGRVVLALALLAALSATGCGDRSVSGQKPDKGQSSKLASGGNKEVTLLGPRTNQEPEKPKTDQKPEKPGKAPVDSSYYPLQQGTKWRYRMIQPGKPEPAIQDIEKKKPDGAWVTQEVTKFQTVKGTKTARIETDSSGAADHIGVGKDGFYRYATLDATFSNPVLILKLPHRDNQTWDVDSKGYPLVKGTFTAVEEKIRVPAGQFQAIKVTGTGGNPMVVGGAKWEMTYWFTKGVGVVKMVITEGVRTQGGITTVLELEEFTPGHGEAIIWDPPLGKQNTERSAPAVQAPPRIDFKVTKTALDQVAIYFRGYPKEVRDTIKKLEPLIGASYASESELMSAIKQKIDGQPGWVDVRYALVREAARKQPESRPQAPQPQAQVDEASAAEWVEKLSGVVTRDEAASGRPVIAVRLSRVGIMDNQLTNLKELKRLKQLDLAYNPGLTGTGLKDLAGLTELQHLILSRTGVTDESLRLLTGLKALRTLDLSNTNITDGGLRELARMRELGEVRVNNTRVSAQAAATLKKDLPNCKIIYLRDR